MMLLLKKIKYLTNSPINKNFVKKHNLSPGLNLKKTRCANFLQKWIITSFIALFFATTGATRELKNTLQNTVEYKIHNVATRICNESIAECMKKKEIDTNLFENVEKSQDGSVSLIQTNSIKINLLRAEISNSIQRKLESIDTEELSIPIGSLLNNELTNGRGIKIPIKMANIYLVNTDIEDEFISSGINQTRHQIIARIQIEIGTNLPGNKIRTNVSTKIPITETIVVGKIPLFYLQK